MHLEQFGWDPAWLHAFNELRATISLAGIVPARVIRTERGASELVSAHGTWMAGYAGHLAPAALGDWVAADPAGARIHAVLPARNRLERLAPDDRGGIQCLAANFHTVAVVMGLDDDFNLSRLERYLALIAASRAHAVVFLNKRDACADPWWRHSQVERIAPQARVELTCALEDDMTALIDSVLPEGQTMILTGSSGAGKSTITNALLGGQVQATRETRASDGRGQHCTTQRRLFLTAHGRLVADLPGLRMVAPADPSGIAEAFQAYDPNDPRQAANRKRMEKEMSRAIRNYKRVSTKW